MNKIDQLLDFLAASPEDSFVRHALALEYIKLGDDQAARVYFENLLEKDPGYVGAYYHLGKLLERNQLVEQAIRIYENGMVVAKKAGDNHAAAELRGALDELMDI